MNITTDIYAKGCKDSGHLFCQDYILKDVNNKYIILADGCSLSKNTDIGARILTNVAKMHLLNNIIDIDKDERGVKNLGESIIELSKIYLFEGIDESTDILSQLDSTLILSWIEYIDDQPSININVYGDGHIIIRDKDDNIELISICYENGCPAFYLSYLLDESRAICYYNNFIEPQRDKHRILFDRILSVLRVSNNMHSITYFRYDEYHPTFIFNRLDRYKSISICSDGLQSFIDPQNKILSVEDIAGKLTTYGVIKGKFQWRSCQYEIEKLSKQGIHNYDDLSIGTYLIGV